MEALYYDTPVIVNEIKSNDNSFQQTINKKMLQSILFTFKQVQIENIQRKYIIVGSSQNLYYIQWEKETILPQKLIEALQDERLVGGFKQDDTLYKEFIEQFKPQIKIFSVQKFLNPPFDEKKFASDEKFVHYHPIYEDGNVFKEKQQIEIDGRFVCEEAFAMTQTLVQNIQDEMKSDDKASMERKEQEQKQKHQKRNQKSQSSNQQQPKFIQQTTNTKQKTLYQFSDKQQSTPNQVSENQNTKNQKPDQKLITYQCIIPKKDQINDINKILESIGQMDDIKFEMKTDQIIVTFSYDQMKQHFDYLTKNVPDVLFKKITQ